MDHIIRKAELRDLKSILDLYRVVARDSGGLARRPEEITPDLIQNLVEECTTTGLILVLEEEKSRQMIGLIHASGSEVEALHHVLSQLTFLIHPSAQKKGFGKKLFRHFLESIEKEFPHIYRVELRARSSNRAALGLYESLGFIREGLFRHRIRSREGELEDGIPMVWFNPKTISGKDHLRDLTDDLC